MKARKPKCFFTLMIFDDNTIGTTMMVYHPAIHEGADLKQLFSWEECSDLNREFENAAKPVLDPFNRDTRKKQLQEFEDEIKQRIINNRHATERS